MKLTVRIAIVLGVCATVLTGCRDQAAPKVLGNGVTNISSKMVGWSYTTIGNQLPTGRRCNWRVYFKRDTDGKHVTVASGSSGKGHWSQTVTFYGHMENYKFASDRCAIWKRSDQK